MTFTFLKRSDKLMSALYSLVKLGYNAYKCPPPKKEKEKQQINLKQLPTGPYMLAIIPLGKTTDWYLIPCTRICPL